MRRLIYFVHASLDGYAATSEGALSWVKIDEQMFDWVHQLTNSATTALYGDNTFKMMQAYWPTAADKPNATKHDREHSAWYNSVEKVVISHSKPDHPFPLTHFIGPDLQAEINEVKQQQGGDILMLGSPGAARSLMELDLIDDYLIFVNPILLGSGIPAYAHNKIPLKLRLRDTVQFDCGVIALRFIREAEGMDS